MPCHDEHPTAEAPVRPRYFFGQLLDVDDLRADQEYSMQKRRVHNRALHGWGVVCGLEVTPSSEATITVLPGYAVDENGRDIVVGEPVSLDVSGDPPSPGGRHQDLDIVLRYAEEPVSPVPSIDGVEEGHPTGQQPSRIEERYEFEVRPRKHPPASDGLVIGHVRRSSAGTIRVLGKPPRYEAIGAQRLMGMVHALEQRVAALESRTR
jgi:hypothetical protein